MIAEEDIIHPGLTPTMLFPRLTEIHARFGADQTLLIAVEENKPHDPDWAALPLARTLTWDYRMDLSPFDTAVVLGPKSLNLAAIRFGKAEQRAEFISKNAALKDSLLTSSPGGHFVWFRLVSDVGGGDGEMFHGGHEHPLCDLFCDGYVVVHSPRKKNNAYKYDNDGQPTLIKLKDITWPKEVATLRALQAVEDDIPMVLIDNHKRLKLNDEYVVGIFRAHNPELCYNPRTSLFYLELEDGRMTPIFEELVKKQFHTILCQIQAKVTRQCLGDTPAALETAIALADGLQAQKQPAKKMTLHIDTGPWHLSTLVNLLKVVTVKPFEIEEQPKSQAPPTKADKEDIAFREFVLTQIERAPGASLTISDAFAGYVAYCAREGLAKLSLRQFQRKIGDAVKRAFDAYKAHDILTSCGGCQRGWRNVRLVGTKNDHSTSGRTEQTPYLPGVDWFDPGLWEKAQTKPATAGMGADCGVATLPALDSTRATVGNGEFAVAEAA
jgi:hypothetical protein